MKLQAGDAGSGPIRPTGVRPVRISALRQDGLRYAGSDVEVSGVTLRAQEAAAGYLFAALSGGRTHGARFTAQAVDAGAVAVLTDEEGAEIIRADAGLADVTVLVHEQPRSVLGAVSAQVYGDPSAAMTLIGVTGTSGKTTTSYLTEAALRAAGRVVGLVGTVEVRIDGTPVPTSLTTPEAPDLQRLFAVMRERGVDTVVMEVSSHALSLGRVDGCHFAVGGFTNLSQDHLDYHGTMQAYFEAKARLFASGSPVRARMAVVCVDDEWGAQMASVAGRDGGTALTVSTTGVADWSVREIVSTGPGSQTVRIAAPDGTESVMTVPLPGGYNVANALLALAMVQAAGVGTETAVGGLATVAVPGRLEKIERGQDFLAVVDYAHKPAAVEAVLATLRVQTTGAIAVVLGAGGDRDTEKRPLMGRAAARGADLVVITDDNPRSEDPSAIRAAVVAGAREAGTTAEIREVGDRREAIAAALAWAGPGDVVLVAGKGHETGQEIAGVKHPFDDRVVVADLLAAAEASRSDEPPAAAEKPRAAEKLRVMVADPVGGIAEARRLVRELVALAADTGVGSAHRIPGADPSRRTWVVFDEFLPAEETTADESTADEALADENRRCVEHDGLGRQIVRLAVDKVIGVGDDVRAVRAFHQGAVMEGSWGDEAVLVSSTTGLVEQWRSGSGGDAPAPGDIVLVSGGALAETLLEFWTQEAGVDVQVLTR